MRKKNKLFRIIGWLAAILVGLILLVMLLIQIPAVQQWGKVQLVSFVSQKIQSEFSLNRLRIRFPKTLLLEGIFLADMDQDTLLSGDRIMIDLNMFGLLKKSIDLHSISLEGIHSEIEIAPDGIPNYQFLLDSFTSKSSTPKSLSSRPYDISLNRLRLKDISLRYLDQKSDIDLSVLLEQFSTQIQVFDLAQNRYNIQQISVDGLKGHFFQESSRAQKPSNTKAEPFPFEMTVGPSTVSNVEFIYKADGITAQTDIDEFLISLELLDLEKQKIDLNTVSLQESEIQLSIAPDPKADTVKSTRSTEKSSSDWKIEIAEVSLMNNSIAYHYGDVRSQDSLLDFNHIELTDFDLIATAVYYSSDSILVDLSKLGVIEKSGLEIDNLTGQVAILPTTSTFQKMNLRTINTSLKFNANLRYPTFQNLAQQPEQIRIDLKVDPSTITMSDFEAFIPALTTNPYLQSIRNERLEISTTMRGRLSKISIADFEFQGLDRTSIIAKGDIRSLTQVEQMTYSFEDLQVKTSKKDLSNIIPSTLIPSNIQIPTEIELNGSVDGTIRGANALIVMDSEVGLLNLEGAFNWEDSISTIATLLVDELDLGFILSQDSILGTLSGQALWNLRMTEPADISGDWEGDLTLLELNNYAYQNIRLEGQAQNGFIDIDMTIDDPHAHLYVESDLRLGSKGLDQLQGRIEVNEFDLQKTMWTSSPLQLKGSLSTDMASIQTDSLNGQLDIQDLVIQDSVKTIQLDSIRIVAQAKQDSQFIQMDSRFLKLRSSGVYTLNTLQANISEILESYLSPNQVVDTLLEPMDLDVQGSLYYTDLWKQLDSNIQSFDSISFVSHLKKDGRIFDLEIRSREAQYAGIHIHNILIKSNTEDQYLQYQIHWDSIHQGDIGISTSNIKGHLRDGEIENRILIADPQGEKKFYLGNDVFIHSKPYVISFQRDSLLLNYETWTIDPQNRIEFAPNHLQIQDLILANEDRKLVIQSSKPVTNAPIQVAFTNFDIETLVQFFSRGHLVAGGTLNGAMAISNYFDKVSCTADLDIAKFSFQGDTIGDVLIDIHNKSLELLNANIHIQGYGNQVVLSGDYNIQNQEIEMDLDLDPLNLVTIQAFSQRALDQAQGSVSGNLNVKGTPLKPIVKGKLLFNEAGAVITQLNGFYRLNNEGLSFDNSDIRFNEFVLFDEDENQIKLDGSVYTQTFTQFDFDLKVHSEDFQVLDTRAGDNKLYYGQLYLDSEINIKGNLKQPIIDADLTIRDPSDMTLIIPQVSPDIVEREGVVKFVDLDNPNIDSVLMINPDTLNTYTVKGIEAVADISIDKESQFKIIIDQGNGDFLNIKGNAELNARIDPRGQIFMTGNYLVEEGIYELTFNFIKRRFQIQKGSKITWNGEPTSANLDITAYYEVEAAPIDLLEQQISDISSSEFNQYKQKLPFQLKLNLTGKLMEPVVSFDIILPERNYLVAPSVISTVRARLDQLKKQESELNKQAFALMLLNSFIGDNPFRRNSGTVTPASYARQSVSKLLSQQLNNLASGLISGVELQFDLTSSEDYTTGELQNRTDLNVTASKRLLNDRIKVTVGSDFQLEGQAHVGQSTNNIAGDISVEYQLSRDGKYLLKAYRQNEYRVAVEGQVIETGLSFIIQMDFDHFREIFTQSNHRE